MTVVPLKVVEYATARWLKIIQDSFINSIEYFVHDFYVSSSHFFCLGNCCSQNPSGFAAEYLYKNSKKIRCFPWGNLMIFLWFLRVVFMEFKIFFLILQFIPTYVLLKYLRNTAVPSEIFEWVPAEMSLPRFLLKVFQESRTAGVPSRVLSRICFENSYRSFNMIFCFRKFHPVILLEIILHVSAKCVLRYWKLCFT